MDALSELLRLADFSAGVTLDATAHAPWCVSVPATPALLRAHAIVAGECRLRTAKGETLALEAGDFVLFPEGSAHLLGHDCDGPAVPFASLLPVPVEGEPVPVRIGGSGPATRWITLSATCERHLAEPLLGALPPVLRVDLRGAASLGRLTDALGLVLSPSDAPFLGAGAARARLAELVCIDAFARHVQAQPPGGKGWLAGLNDRYVGRALALVHGRPSEPWTVEKLGRQVRLSRSALAERFSDVMGEPIFAFLTRWRLIVAAEALRGSARPVQAIAREAGYESAGAFSAAFKRHFRKPPTAWRRKAQARRTQAG